MRRIGDKPPALLLRDLEPSRQLVKLLSQLRQLIVSIHGDPMGVLPGPHRADSPQEGPDPPGKERGKGPKQNQYRQADHHGDQPQVPLQLLQQCPLVTVLVIQTDRPHHLVSIHHRGGGPAGEGPVLVLTGKGVVAPEGGDHLSNEGIFPQGGGLPGIVENPSRPVRDQNPPDLQLLQLANGLLHRLRRELVGGGEGVGDQNQLVGQGGLLGTKHQILSHNQGIGIHQNQQNSNETGISQGKTHLQGVADVPLSPHWAPFFSAPAPHASLK